jgi:hypothetical protein
LVAISDCLALRKISRERIDAKKAAGQPLPVYRSFSTLSKSPPPYPYSPLRKVRLYLGRWGMAGI